MNAIKLQIIHFDELENRLPEAIVISEECIFIDEEGKNAFVKCGEYLRSKSYKPYLGWDDEVYPQFIIKRFNVK